MKRLPLLCVVACASSPTKTPPTTPNGDMVSDGSAAGGMSSESNANTGNTGNTGNTVGHPVGEPGVGNTIDSKPADAKRDSRQRPDDDMLPDKPPKPRRPEVKGSIVIDAAIGATAPTITVTLRNGTPAAIPYGQVTKPACWAFLHLRAELTRPGKTSTTTIKPCKGEGLRLASLDPGASTTIKVPLGELFDKLVIGRYDLDLDWDTTELAKLDSKGALDGDLDMPRRSFAIAKLVSTFSITKGKTVALAGTAKLKFTAHGHKEVMAGGPPSPLIIRGEIIDNGKPTEVGVNHQVEDHEPFALDGHVFELLAFEYDASMKLRYWGKLKLDD